LQQLDALADFRLAATILHTVARKFSSALKDRDIVQDIISRLDSHLLPMPFIESDMSNYQFASSRFCVSRKSLGPDQEPSRLRWTAEKSSTSASSLGKLLISYYIMRAIPLLVTIHLACGEIDRQEGYIILLSTRNTYPSQFTYSRLLDYMMSILVKTLLQDLI
jgi:hypothetical protein